MRDKISCSRLRKKDNECQSMKGCHWVVGKGCQRLERWSNPCRKLRKKDNECDGHEECEWLVGTGCIKSKSKTKKKSRLSRKDLDFFHKNGYLVISKIRDDEFIDNYVREIWRCITEAPWSEDKGIPNIPGGPFAQLKGSGANKEDKDWLRNLKLGKANSTLWFPGQFSAPNIPPFYNLKYSWRNRQSDKFYRIFSQLMSSESGKSMKKLWCSLDRISVKPPGMGDQDSFYHWDSDPWYWDDDKYVGLQGMLSLSNESSFTLFRTTHSLKFRDKFIDRKRGLGRNHSKKPNWVKLGEIGKKEAMIIIDPALQSKLDHLKQVISLDKGDLIIWSNRLLHLASKNKSDFMRYAQYIQYDPAGCCLKNGKYINQNPEIFPDGDRPEIIDGYRKLGLDIHDVDDRIRSFNSGKKPLLLPGGGRTPNVPEIWKSQFKHLNTRYALRFKDNPENPTRKINKYKKSKQIDEEGKYYDKLLKEKVYPYEMIEWDPKKVIGSNGKPLYQKPKLTELGKKLLGIECWGE